MNDPATIAAAIIAGALALWVIMIAQTIRATNRRTRRPRHKSLPLALALLIPAAAGAQVDLRVVRGGDYGPVSGLTGHGALSSFPITELPAHPELIRAGMIRADIPDQTRRAMAVFIDVVNVGPSPAMTGNIFAHPERFYFSPWYAPPYIRGLYGVTLAGATTTNSYALTVWPYWNQYTPLISPGNGWMDPGFLPGYATTTEDPWTQGAFVDITGLPDGLYTLTVTIDPAGVFGWAGTTTGASVQIDLRGFDARLTNQPNQ